MDRIAIRTLLFAAGAATAFGQAPRPVGTAESPQRVAVVQLPSTGSDIEWSQGEPFVGAAALTTSHGFQPMAEDQGPTALIPASSGLSLIVLGRTAAGYRLGFDEAQERYLVKLFGANGRLLRLFVVYPGQDALALPYSKLPGGGPVYLSVHDEAGQPLQGFKLFERVES
jgi:hypothetical protein